MGKVKHFIKEGKIIRETKTGKKVELEEVSQEEFEKYESRKSMNGCMWSVTFFLFVVVLIITVLYQL